MRNFWVLLRHDLLLHWRRGHELFNPLMFFVLVLLLFPLGLTPEPDLLKPLAPGIVWVAALLAVLMASHQLFRDDYEDGSLALIVLTAYPLSLWVFARVLSHWLSTVMPLVIIAPVLMLMFDASSAALGVLVFSLLLGTPVLSLTAAIGSALTVSLKNNGMLVALLVLPLYVPVLIFGSNAVSLSMQGFNVQGQLYLLAGLCLLSVSLAPLAIAAALRMSVSQ